MTELNKYEQARLSYQKFCFINSPNLKSIPLFSLQLANNTDKYVASDTVTEFL